MFGGMPWLEGAAAVCLGLGPGGPVADPGGDDWCLETKALAPDGGFGDQFGFAISLSGNVALVGAPLDDSIRGAAYAFHRDSSGWVYEAKLVSLDGESGDRFGSTVAVQGDVAVIGAHADDDLGDDAGAAYVFRRLGGIWQETQKLLAADGAAGDFFGRAVALDGDRMVLGARGHDELAPNAGAAYVFRRIGVVWIEEAKLLASSGSMGDWFGYATAIRGNVVAVGAVGDDERGTDTGSVYVFRLDEGTWNEEQRLLASDPAGGDWFGEAVTAGPERVLVGVPQHDHVGVDSGAAFVFRHEEGVWVEEQELLAPDGAPGDAFGVSVALDGDIALVGSRRDSDAGDSSGSAYVFRSDDAVWSKTRKIVPSQAASGDEFGFAVAAEGGRAVVGAPFDADNGFFSGSIYMYTTCVSAVGLDVEIDPGQVCEGAPTYVEYRYTVSAPGGFALSEVAVSDARCSPVALVSGDENGDGILTPPEAWVYECTVLLTTGVTGTSSVEASAVPSQETLAVEVEVSVPSVPGTVNVAHIIAVMLGWGPCPVPPAVCPADWNADGVVDVLDLLEVILAWQTC